MNHLKMTIKEGLTANNVAVYQKEFEKILTEIDDFSELILDLAGNDNIDSTGVTFIISVFKRAKAMEKSFRVVGANADVQMLFKLMKLDQFFEMSD